MGAYARQIHSIPYFGPYLQAISYYTKFYIPQDITTCDMSPCDLSAIARIAQKAIQSSKDGQVDLVKLLETAIKRASLVDYPLFEDSSDTGTVTRPKKTIPVHPEQAKPVLDQRRLHLCVVHRL